MAFWGFCLLKNVF